MHIVPHPAWFGAGWVDNVHALPVLIYNCVKFRGLCLTVFVQE